MGAKWKIAKAVDKKCVELAEDLQYYDGEKLEQKTTELEMLLKAKSLLARPKMSKETFVELLKILGILAALGVVIWYDASGHVLPKSLDKWIPGPRL